MMNVTQKNRSRNKPPNAGSTRPLTIAFNRAKPNCGDHPMIKGLSWRGRPKLDRSIQMSARVSPQTRDSVKALSKKAEVCVADLFEVWVTRAKKDEAFERQSIDEARALHKSNLVPKRPEKLLTVKETAALLRCSTSTIYAEIKRGHLKVIPIGRALRILSSSLPSPTKGGPNG